MKIALGSAFVLTGALAAAVAANGSQTMAGRLGARAYPVAAKLIKLRNLRSKRLDTFQKRYLRPHFGALVDQVRVSYGSRLLNKTLRSQETARTFGKRIYLAAPYAKGDLNQLVEIAHEMVHVRQFVACGGCTRTFGARYMRERQRVGKRPRQNRYEREADAFRGYFIAWLNGQGRPATPRGGLSLGVTK